MRDIYTLHAFVSYVWWGILVARGTPSAGAPNGPDPSSCGINKYTKDPLSTRIVGGKDVEPGEYPWQVSIRLHHPQVGSVGHWCGGTLIDDRWIATAAHCIINPLFVLPQATFWEIRMGDHNLQTSEGNEKTIRVSKVVHYPWYDKYDNDIALMKLSKPYSINDYIRPICLPSDNEKFVGIECVATGWGKIDYNKKSSPVLQKVKIKVYDTSECFQAYQRRYRITLRQWHLCAGTKDGGKGTCHGDSGGPLQCQMDDGKWYLAGITSFGSGCAKRGYPDVYSRVTHFMKWINETRTNNQD